MWLQRVAESKNKKVVVGLMVIVNLVITSIINLFVAVIMDLITSVLYPVITRLWIVIP